MGDPSATETIDVHQHVRERYARAASESGCCGGGCDCTDASSTIPIQHQTADSTEQLRSLGYSEHEIAQIPKESNLGLGCGNPFRMAQLKLGETVLDLGSGGGIDCFVAAERVGPRGWVVGVDMTPEMISRAQENARKGGHRNVEFRFGEIEHLPLEDRTVDVILSNCVVNLVPNKRAAYAEAFRVLKAGGRLAITDMVALARISQQARKDASRWTSCLSGAETIDVLRSILKEVGFEQIRIATAPSATGETCCSSGGETGVVSAQIEAIKPLTNEP